MDRIIKQINDNWEFYIPGRKQSRQRVCLPHTISLVPANSSGGRNYQGICVYEKRIYIGEECADKKAFIEFEGAMGLSELYVNDVHVKTHYCGYTPLIADITDKITCGAENHIYIKLDNRDNEEVPPGKPQRELDFCYDGGLYREARLTFTNKVYVTNAILAEEIAGGGIFVSFREVSEENAVVNVKTHIRNDNEEEKYVAVLQRLLDAEGNVAAEAEESGIVSGGAGTYFEKQLSVDHPRLWCVESPYLYRLETTVMADGNVVDTVHTEVGIRTFQFTLKDGIVFNGKSKRLSGANYHQTYPYIGNAVPNSLLKRDILKLKETGMENIRSHYPFSSEFVSFCNKVGMTMVVSNVGWQFYQEGVFAERVCQNLRDIIRWQRNNPCIILWEPILNESEISFENQKKLHDIVHEEYPYAPCYTASDWGPTDVAYKEYDPGMLGQGLEKYGLVEQENTEPKPMWIREYGDVPDNYFDQNASWRTPRGWGDYAMLQSVERMLGRFDTTEGTYTKVCNNKEICGYGIWPGIEHNRGYHLNPCWGGYYDLFRLPKFSHYFMRSQVDREIGGDCIFIANYWTETSPGDVTVYSNAQKVRLYHNDVLVGEQEPDDVAVGHPPFTFKEVRRRFKGRERSVLRAEAVCDGRVVKETAVMSPGVPKRLKLEADFMGIPLVADGADIVCVYCWVLDEEGNTVPLSAENHPIQFEVEGEGKIIGDNTIGANPVKPEGGIATVLIRSTQKPGAIWVKAKMLWPQMEGIGIKEGAILIQSNPEQK